MKAITNMTQKQKRGIVIVMITSICLIYLLYTTIIPRTELSADTTVHYSFSGIMIGITIQNSGTLDISEMTLNVTVYDEDDEIVHQEEVLITSLGKGDKVVHSLSFKAPQRDHYRLVMRFDFTSDGLEYSEEIEHEMKDYMNFIWKDTVRDWRL
jgi:hypothetical protein